MVDGDHEVAPTSTGTYHYEMLLIGSLDCHEGRRIRVPEYRVWTSDCSSDFSPRYSSLAQPFPSVPAELESGQRTLAPCMAWTWDLRGHKARIDARLPSLQSLTSARPPRSSTGPRPTRPRPVRGGRPRIRLTWDAVRPGPSGLVRWAPPRLSTSQKGKAQPLPPGTFLQRNEPMPA